MNYRDALRKKTQEYYLTKGENVILYLLFYIKETEVQSRILAMLNRLGMLKDREESIKLKKKQCMQG